MDPKSITRNATFSFENGPQWLRNRELNVFPRNYSIENDTKNIIYRNLRPVARLPIDDSMVRSEHGAIFGMNFAPDGSVLVAACEKKALLVMDPLTRRISHKLDRVHSDCVNSVKFLDSRLFATCSDDHKVKLWDLRFMKEQHPVRVLSGHTNWVKNVEYIPSEGVLLTSGFDHFVFAWELNQYSESATEEFQRVLYTPGLIRMCLTRDCSKMIISTQCGYLLVVHNLDIHSCSKDMAGFQPNACWMMMKSNNTADPSLLESTIRQFHAARNRTELIVDFPTDNDAENITSLTPHPHGWCVLSRNTNAGDTYEWSCVHDIQLPPVDDLSGLEKPASLDQPCSSPPAVNEDPPFVSWSDLLETSADPVPSTQRTRKPNVDCVLPRTYRRLTHYIEEPNVGRGFIKEQSFSADGRLIASPFGFGVRLLSFDEKCSELSTVSPLRVYEERIWPNADDGPRQDMGKRRGPQPVPLYEAPINLAHESVVLCAEFSPVHYLLATGCYNGKISFHEPVL